MAPGNFNREEGFLYFLDANGDGQLSIREMRNAWNRLAAFDRDGWRAMQTGIPAVRSMKDHATFLSDLYADLTGSSRAHQPQVVSLG